MSVITLAAAVIEAALPLCVRPVAPFLEEAQAILRGPLDTHKGHVAMYCIDHGFELVDRFQLTLGNYVNKE